MFAGTKNASISPASNSSVDWECDVESQSWSSSASWSDDVENDATSRLWQQLQDIDSVLYGEASPKILSPALRQEVAQWRATFPHLRVCGSRPPMCARPAEKEEGQEEVYASHGEVCKQSDSFSNENQSALQEKLKDLVLEKLFVQLRPQAVSTLQSSRSARDSGASVVNHLHHREPLLANRQSARRETIRKLPVPHETDLGGILRVSPLPRTGASSISKIVPQSSRSSVVLPPIDPPVRGTSSATPLSVSGSQTRLNYQRAKIPR